MIKAKVTWNWEYNFWNLVFADYFKPCLVYLSVFQTVFLTNAWILEHYTMVTVSWDIRNKFDSKYGVVKEKSWINFVTIVLHRSKRKSNFAFFVVLYLTRSLPKLNLEARDFFVYWQSSFHIIFWQIVIAVK